jgi:hypothetical protein
MTSIASFSVRQLRITIALLVVALFFMTLMTIHYATSGNADPSTGRPGTSNSNGQNDFPGSSNTHGRMNLPGSPNMHVCFRPTVPC